jgi:hypothetical protein
MLNAATPALASPLRTVKTHAGNTHRPSISPCQLSAALNRLYVGDTLHSCIHCLHAQCCKIPWMHMVLPNVSYAAQPSEHQQSRRLHSPNNCCRVLHSPPQQLLHSVLPAPDC